MPLAAATDRMSLPEDCAICDNDWPLPTSTIEPVPQDFPPVLAPNFERFSTSSFLRMGVHS